MLDAVQLEQQAATRRRQYRKCVPKGVCTLYNTHHPTLRGVAAGCLTQGLLAASEGPRGSAFGRDCVKTPLDTKFACTRTIAEVLIVDPGAFYEADIFLHSSYRAFLHSLGQKRTLGAS